VCRDVIWQPGHVAEESTTATADGLGDGRETSGRGDCVIADKLVPFDLQQLSLALHNLLVIYNNRFLGQSLAKFITRGNIFTQQNSAIKQRN